MSTDGDWGTPSAMTGEYFNLPKAKGHLVAIFPRGYKPFKQTKFTVQGKQSDAINCDVIDLDEIGEDGLEGKLYRNVDLMQARLIQALKPMIDGKVLGRIAQEPSAMGNPAWVLHPADADGIARANIWRESHPNFVPSTFSYSPPELQQPPVQQAPPQQQPQQWQPVPQQQTNWPTVQPQWNPPPPPPQQPPLDHWGQPQGPPPQWAVSNDSYQQAPPPPPPPPPAYPQGPPPGAQGHVGASQMSVLDRLREQNQQGWQPALNPEAERQQYGY